MSAEILRRTYRYWAWPAKDQEAFFWWIIGCPHFVYKTEWDTGFISKPGWPELQSALGQ
jgi:hypothetical protein